MTGFVLSDKKTAVSRPPDSAALTQRWLRVGEVAQVLGVSATTVRRWTDAGKVRSHRSLGGHRRYLEGEIRTLLAAQPPWQPRSAATGTASDGGRSDGDGHAGGRSDGGDGGSDGDGGGEAATGADTSASAKAGGDSRNGSLSVAHVHELVELGVLAARTGDVEELLRVAAERLLRLTDSTTCDIWRRKSTSGAWLCLTSVNRSGLDDTQVGELVELIPPSAALALTTDESVIAISADGPHCTQRAVDQLIKRGFTSGLRLRLVADDRVIGLIDLWDARQRTYAEHVDFARHVAELLGGAVAQALVREHLEEGNHELRSLVAAGLELGASLDVEAVLASAAARMRAAAEARFCDLYALAGDFITGLVSVTDNGIDTSFVGTTYPLAEFELCQAAIASGEPVGRPDILASTTMSAGRRREYKQLGLRAGLVIPLVNQGAAIGLAVLATDQPREIGHQEILRGLGQVAAQAITNATLHRQLDETARRLTLMNEQSFELSASLDRNDIALATARRLCASLDAPNCAISLLVGSTVDCLLNMVDGVVEPQWTGRKSRLKQWPAMKFVAEQHAPLVFASLDDERLCEASRAAYRSFGEKSGMLVPLVSDNKVIGVAELLENRYERVFSDDEIITAEAICRIAALAIEKAGFFATAQLASNENALLNEIAKKTAATLDVSEVAAAAAGELRRLVSFDNATLYLLEHGVFRNVYSTHAGNHTLAGLPLTALKDEYMRSLQQQTVIQLELAEQNPFRVDAALAAKVAAVVVIGLRTDDQLIGVLALSSAVPHFFATIDNHLLERVGAQLSLAVKNARLYEEIKQMHLSNLKALSSALNAKDYYTLGHAARVSAYMFMMGRELGWSDEYTRQAEEAAYLHDIGKIGISDRVLLKPGKLNAQEWDLMRQHPVFSANIIHSLFDTEFVAGVRHHHERYDGGGYPDGLSGEHIPLIARAMCVVDAYDAMSFQRPYHQALGYDDALAELRRCRGEQFDPVMIDAFLRVLTRLESRRVQATALAHKVAATIDPRKHGLLRSPADMNRPEYAEIVDQLRALRAANPPARFITTYARVDERVVVIADSGETEDDFSKLGDELIMDISLDLTFRGLEPAGHTLMADEFGVWITGVAPLRDGDRGGDVVAAVTVDLPPFASSDTQSLRGDGKQTLAAMLQTAAVRLSRAEIDAVTDSLTGLYNRRYLNERLTEEIDRAGEQGSPLSLLFGDLDHFKQFNDALGHSAGDRALRNVAQVFEQSLRRVDLAARYGGEEFVAVLVDTDADGAHQVAERIRRAIHREAHESGPRPLSMSIGTATFPGDGQTKEELLDKADWAMYLAKRRGRNRVQPFRPADATAAERASLAQRHVAGSSF